MTQGSPERCLPWLRGMTVGVPLFLKWHLRAVPSTSCARDRTRASIRAGDKAELVSFPALTHIVELMVPRPLGTHRATKAVVGDLIEAPLPPDHVV